MPMMEFRIARFQTLHSEIGYYNAYNGYRCKLTLK